MTVLTNISYVIRSFWYIFIAWSTWWLWASRAHICHKYHKLYLWRKNCHVGVFWKKNWEFLRDFATIYALSCLGTLSPKSIFVEKKMTNMRSASESERPLIDSGVTRWASAPDRPGHPSLPATPLLPLGRRGYGRLSILSFLSFFSTWDMDPPPCGRSLKTNFR